MFEGLGALLFSASLWALTTSPLLSTPPDPTVENHYEFVLTLKTVMNLFFWCPNINSRAEGRGDLVRIKLNGNKVLQLRSINQPKILHDFLSNHSQSLARASQRGRAPMPSFPSKSYEGLNSTHPPTVHRYSVPSTVTPEPRSKPLITNELRHGVPNASGGS